MAADPWRQWAAFAALFNPTADTPVPGTFRPSSAAFAPLLDAEQFAAAARAFHQSGQDAQTAAAAFGDFLRDRFGDVLGGMWGGLAADPSIPLCGEAPALGPAREHQERLQRAAAAWRRLQTAQRRLQRLWSDALNDAARAFVSRLEPPAAPPTPETLNDLYDAWIDCAEDAYARIAHGEMFATALADAVAAASDWREECAASSEAWAKWLDWPTRSEVNALSLRVRALEAQRESKRQTATPTRPSVRKRATAGRQRASAGRKSPARGKGKR